MHPPKGYTYLSMLGHGQTITWLARSEDTGDKFVIKTLELQNVSDWKGIELYEREAQVLRQLSHPCIPKFIDFVKDEYKDAKRWHIVQEYIEGSTPDTDRSWSENDLHLLTESLLETLVYLQSFSPPLLHRDIKPENIVKTLDTYNLIDFGSVRHIIPSDEGGSTVVGTSGYMAPEQLMGRADTSSDLYGLGMTLIHLVSGKHPDDLEKKRMVVHWTKYQNKLSDEFVTFLNKLSEPHAEHRFKDAREALENLNSQSTPPTDLVRQPDALFDVSVLSQCTVVKFQHRPKPIFFGVGKDGDFLLFCALGIPVILVFAAIIHSVLFILLLLALTLAALFKLFYVKKTVLVFSKQGMKLNNIRYSHIEVPYRISKFLAESGNLIKTSDSIPIRRELLKIASYYSEDSQQPDNQGES